MLSSIVLHIHLCICYSTLSSHNPIFHHSSSLPSFPSQFLSIHHPVCVFLFPSSPPSTSVIQSPSPSLSALLHFHLFLQPSSLLGPGTETFLTWTYLSCRTAPVPAPPDRLCVLHMPVAGCLTPFLEAWRLLRLICSTSTFVLNGTHLKLCGWLALAFTKAMLLVDQ